MVIAIEKAEYLREYQIKLSFSDGVHKVTDFYDFLREAKHPSTKKYLDKVMFQKFKIEYGDITWNDYELCFPIWDLHEGKI